MMSFQSDSPNVIVGARFVRPAEFTRISTLPKDSIVSERRCCNESRSETSEQTRNDRTPRFSISEAAFSTSSLRRELGMTSAPASAKPYAIALPMPEVPPITTATLPLKSRGLKLIFRPRYLTFGRVQPGCYQMDDEQRDEVRRARYDEDRQVRTGPFEKVAHYLGDQHPP